MRKSALVTGGAGFLGRHFAETLQDLDWDVITVDVLGAPKARTEQHRIFSRGTWTHLKTDVHNFTRSNTGPDAPVFDLVVHCAAVHPHRRAIDSEPVNLVRNVRLDSDVLGWALDTRQRHVLYVSSSAVYPTKPQIDPQLIGHQLAETLAGDFTLGEPDGHYGWTKLLGERMADAARDAELPVTVVRPFSGYGADQSEDFPFRAFVERARRREDPFVIWGDAYQVRDWIHVSDLVNAALAVTLDETQDPLHRRPVNLCLGEGVSMFYLAQTICRSFDYDPEIVVDENAPMGVRYRVGSPDRMLEYYEPEISIEEGVALATGKRDRE